MASTNHVSAFPAGEAIVAASRQVWLASLGAAVVTREWAENEAGALFRTLVKEGTAVESRTFRKVGERLESSFTMANDFWRTARGSMAHTVKQAADTATTLVRDKLPKRLPKVALPAAFRAPATGKRRSGRTAKVAARGTARTANAAKKTVKRVAKRATRRG